MPKLPNACSERLVISGGYNIPAACSLNGIAFDTDLAKTPPISLEGLWRPEFRGQIRIARASSYLGLVTLAIAAWTHGGSEGDLKIGWSKLQALQPKARSSPEGRSGRSRPSRLGPPAPSLSKPDLALADDLVHRARRDCVVTVMVAGDVIYEDGNFTQLDRLQFLRGIADRMRQPLTAQEVEPRSMELAREYEASGRSEALICGDRKSFYSS